MTLSSDLELLIDVDMNVVANWTARYLFGIHSGNVRDVGFDDWKRPSEAVTNFPQVNTQSQVWVELSWVIWKMLATVESNLEG